MLSEPVPTLPFCPGCPRFSIFGPPSAPSSISVVLLDLGQTAQSCRQGRGRGQDPLPWLLPLGRQGRGRGQGPVPCSPRQTGAAGPSSTSVVLLEPRGPPAGPKTENRRRRVQNRSAGTRSPQQLRACKIDAKSIDDPQRRSFARQQPQQRAGRGGERTIIRRGAAGRKNPRIFSPPTAPARQVQLNRRGTQHHHGPRIDDARRLRRSSAPQARPSKIVRTASAGAAACLHSRSTARSAKNDQNRGENQPSRTKTPIFDFAPSRPVRTARLCEWLRFRTTPAAPRRRTESTAAARKPRKIIK